MSVDAPGLWRLGRWVRAIWARWDAAAIRRSVSRLIDPVVAQRGVRSDASAGTADVAELGGPLRVDPSGTVLSGRQVVGRAPDALQTDWFVAAFPSPLVINQGVLPLGYGLCADAATLLCDALPAALWLHQRDSDAVLLMGLQLARQNATQEALNARLFPCRVKPHAAHRVAEVAGVWQIPPNAPAEFRHEAAERLSAAFPQRAPCDVVALLPAGHPQAAALRSAWGKDAVIDPDQTPLWHWAPKLLSAQALVTAQGHGAAFAALAPNAAHTTLGVTATAAAEVLAWQQRLD